MLTESVVASRIRSLDAEAFPEFVAAVWREAGWRVNETPDDGVAVVSRPGTDGRERIVLRAVTAPGAVTPDAVREAADRTDGRDVDGVATVTPTGYTPAALEVADALGVDAVGPDAVARIVVALDADDAFARADPDR
jgi:hypothetical protein